MMFLTGAGDDAPGGSDIALLTGSTVCWGMMGGGVGGGMETDRSGE